MATVIFSSAILGFLAVGTLYQFVSGFDIMMLGGTFGALAYKKTGYEFYIRNIESILPANIAYMLEARKNQQKMLFTQDESRDIIEWLEGKFSKQKSYINFFINTSMLIGLLGTFVGLVESIDKMGQIILSLNGDVDIKDIMQQFSGPLSGMAIGFGASLFGVVSAVILGLNGYILFRYQDTLISGIEEWLKDRIIDVAPQEGTSTGISSSSDLTGHRKSFLDIFLEQMSDLTVEMGKISKSNERFDQIASTFTMIQTSVQEQKNYFASMIEIQQKFFIQSESLTNTIINLHTSGNSKLDEHKAIFENLTQNNRTIATQSYEKFDEMNQKIAMMVERMERNDHVLNAILSVNERTYEEANRMHGESLNELSVIADNIHLQSEGIDRVQTKIDYTNQRLENVLTAQTKEFEHHSQAYRVMIQNLENVGGSIREGITLLEKHADTQKTEAEKGSNKQLQLLNSMDNIAVSLARGEEKVLLSHQASAEQSRENSVRVAQILGELKAGIESNKQALESIFSQNENISTQDGQFQANALSVLEKMSDALSNNQMQNQELLSISASANQETSNGFSEVSKFITELKQGLSGIEKIISAYIEDRKSEDIQFTKIMQQQHTNIVGLDDKIDEASMGLHSNAETLHKIEKIVSSIETKSTLRKSREGKKKGFFSSFFKR
ncbi:MAG: hypothetical protein JZU62_09950 [Sulfuricurvum sp.]|uniref:hypothetical protein n=1 Tax=Sulfuricurvum sp. TaxID=2025608 RepID=UPI0025FDF049|nr:hypothetical protein [Sulfuricurvum sp.]MBV5322002.1 hypothetical protein [Sulfuricurvum sp.]